MDMYGSSMTAKEHIKVGFIKSYHAKFLLYTSPNLEQVCTSSEISPSLQTSAPKNEYVWVQYDL